MRVEGDRRDSLHRSWSGDLVAVWIDAIASTKRITLMIQNFQTESIGFDCDLMFFAVKHFFPRQFMLQTLVKTNEFHWKGISAVPRIPTVGGEQHQKGP